MAHSETGYTVSYAGTWEANGFYSDDSGTVCELPSVEYLAKIQSWSKHDQPMDISKDSERRRTSYMYRLKTGKWIISGATKESTLYISVNAADTPPVSEGGCGKVWESVHGDDPCPSVVLTWKGKMVIPTTRTVPTTAATTTAATTAVVTKTRPATTTKTTTATTTKTTTAATTTPSPLPTAPPTRTTNRPPATTPQRPSTLPTRFPTRPGPPVEGGVPIKRLVDGSRQIFLHFTLNSNTSLPDGSQIHIPDSATMKMFLKRLQADLEGKGVDTAGVRLKVLPNHRDGANRVPSGGTPTTGGLNNNGQHNVAGVAEEDMLVQVTILANATAHGANKAEGLSDIALSKLFERKILVQFENYDVVGHAIKAPPAIISGGGAVPSNKGNNGANSEDAAGNQGAGGSSASAVVRVVLPVVVCLFLVSGSVMVMMTKRRRLEQARAQEATYGQQAQRYENPQYDKYGADGSGGGSVAIGKFQAAIGRGGGGIEDGAMLPLLVDPPQTLLDERGYHPAHYAAMRGDVALLSQIICRDGAAGASVGAGAISAGMAKFARASQMSTLSNDSVPGVPLSLLGGNGGLADTDTTMQTQKRGSAISQLSITSTGSIPGVPESLLTIGALATMKTEGKMVLLPTIEHAAAVQPRETQCESSPTEQVVPGNSPAYSEQQDAAFRATLSVPGSPNGGGSGFGSGPSSPMHASEVSEADSSDGGSETAMSDSGDSANGGGGYTYGDEVYAVGSALNPNVQRDMVPPPTSSVAAAAAHAAAAAIAGTADGMVGMAGMAGMARGQAGAGAGAGAEQTSGGGGGVGYNTESGMPLSLLDLIGSDAQFLQLSGDTQTDGSAGNGGLLPEMNGLFGSGVLQDLEMESLRSSGGGGGSSGSAGGAAAGGAAAGGAAAAGGGGGMIMIDAAPGYTSGGDTPPPVYSEGNVDHGVLNVQDLNGNTPLAWTARIGHADAMMRLLEFKANVELRNSAGLTPLHTASMLYKDAQMCHLLLQAGAQVDARDAEGNTPLMHAGSTGAIEVVGGLLAAGASVAAPNFRGSTALIQASIHGQRDVLGHLLQEAAANPEQQDSTGRTALHWACAVGAAQCADLLVTFKPESVFAESQIGDTCCHVAVRTNRVDIVRMLFAALTPGQRKKLLEWENGSGLTPVQLAAQVKANECSQVLAVEVARKKGGRNASGGGGGVGGRPSSGDSTFSLGLLSDGSTSDATMAGAGRTKRAAPSSTAGSSDSDGVGGTANTGGKPKKVKKKKQTAEEARARRRNYMRDKREDQLSKERGARTQVDALERENRDLVDTVVTLRREAARLRQELGLV